MPVRLQEHADQKLLDVHVTGELQKADYEKFVPAVDEFVKQQGKIRILVELHDFRGWDSGALWEDIKFGARHFNDIERLAVVGDKKWETGLTVFCKPFTTAEIRFFPIDDRSEAKTWIKS